MLCPGEPRDVCASAGWYVIYVPDALGKLRVVRGMLVVGRSESFGRKEGHGKKEEDIYNLSKDEKGIRFEAA